MTSRKRTLQSRVLEHCQVSGLFPENGRVLVAVSGGADSMVLLHCLHQGRKALGITPVVAHVDHGLRQDSAEDAAFVLDHASGMGLKAVGRRVDVRATARAGKLSLEDAGRRDRYAALGDMARETGATLIATGHTATDQAETVLMRMVRGTGPLGLGGIDPSRPDGLTRPLLCVTREEVRQEARSGVISFRDDHSNRELRYLRNRVRRQLLPLLVGMNPRVEFTLSELAESAGALAGWVDGMAADVVVPDGEGGRMVGAAHLKTCDTALLPYVVRAAFKEVTESPLGLSRSHIEAVVRLGRQGGGPGKVHLPRGVTVIRDRRGLRFVKGEAKRR